MPNQRPVYLPRRHGPKALRPAGSIDQSLVGLVLRGLAPTSVVAIDGRVVVPDADGFVPVPAVARREAVQAAPASSLEISEGAQTRLAFVRLQAAPPRVLDAADVPVVYIAGDIAPRSSAPARVELYGFVPGTRVLVNGAAPARLSRDEQTGLYTVSVPSGDSTIYVEQPPGSAGMSGPGESPLRLGPGDIIELTPDNFTIVPRRGSAPAIRPPDAATEVPDEYRTMPATRTDAPATSPPATTPPPTDGMQVTSGHGGAGAGYVEVAVDVAEASVTIGGVPVGGPPYRAELAPGSYDLVVSAPGMRPYAASVTVSPGLVTPVRVALEALPQRGPSAAKVAVVVLAAVALAVGVAVALPSGEVGADGDDGRRAKKATS